MGVQLALVEDIHKINELGQNNFTSIMDEYSTIITFLSQVR